MMNNGLDEIITFLNGKILELLESPGSEHVIDVNKNLTELGMDSKNTINLVVQIEQYYDITFDDDELLLENFDTMATIAANIQSKLGVTQ